ncbi:MAG: site-specific integrase [Waddliaceae bacterium]
MTITTTQEDHAIQLTSRDEDLQVYDKFVWNTIKKITVEEAYQLWVNRIKNPHTKKNYQSAFNRLVFHGIIDPLASISTISIAENHRKILSKIGSLDLKEATKQARAAAYIAFTKFLAQEYPRNFDRAYPIKADESSTFGKVREIAETKHMSLEEWTRFFGVLEKINQRDCLIAKMILQGGRRACEVLSLHTDQIDWDNNIITYTVSKTGKMKRERFITYPDSIISQLKEYLDGRTGTVFITRTGKPVPIVQLQNTFAKAGYVAGIKFKIHPHVLRASCITFLRQQGFKDCDILKVSGHSRAEMINYYDKTALKENPSAKVNLVR